MAEARRDAGLRTIFSLFLGLMLTAFVGVGVYTFHPPPEQSEARMHELAVREEAIRSARARAELTASEQEQLQEISRERRALLDAAQEARKPWGRSTAIILIIFATVVMAVSLVRADQLPVISNGLLLGGLFTMLYGVGWIVATDTSITRFFVMTAALAITLGLGYVRFVRRRAGGPGVPGASEPAVQSAALSEIEARVRDLELRLSDAASALGATRDR